MTDDTHQLLTGAIKEVVLWENIIRSCDPNLAQEKRNGNEPLFKKFIKESEQNDDSYITRIYKTLITMQGMVREGRIRFIYDSRNCDKGKVVIAMPNEFRQILKPIPNPSLGITELLIDERVSTHCMVCRVAEGGLGVNLICPFCKGIEKHVCKI